MRGETAAVKGPRRRGSCGQAREARGAGGTRRLWSTDRAWAAVGGRRAGWRGGQVKAFELRSGSLVYNQMQKGREYVRELTGWEQVLLQRQGRARALARVTTAWTPDCAKARAGALVPCALARLCACGPGVGGGGQPGSGPLQSSRRQQVDDGRAAAVLARTAAAVPTHCAAVALNQGAGLGSSPGERVRARACGWGTWG